MRVRYGALFKKQYKKMPVTIRERFGVRLALFLQDPANPQLRVHPLKGKYVGYWSMNITGDVRAIYFMQGEDIVIFAFIGTHSELYG